MRRDLSCLMLFDNVAAIELEAAVGACPPAAHELNGNKTGDSGVLSQAAKTRRILVFRSRSMKSTPTFILLLLMLVLAACSAAVPATNEPTVPVVPYPTITVEPTAPPLSFTPAVYRSEAEGFELDYPADWTAVPITEIGSRGSQGQLLSPGTTAESLAEGGSRLNITVYLWDPKNDLAAFAIHRTSAWQASGFTVRQGPSGDLTDGRKYVSFIIETSDKKQAFFLFTTLGEKYLEISGEGNLALAEEIAKTVRPLGTK